MKKMSSEGKCSNSATARTRFIRFERSPSFPQPGLQALLCVCVCVCVYQGPLHSCNSPRRSLLRLHVFSYPPQSQAGYALTLLTTHPWSGPVAPSENPSNMGQEPYVSHKATWLPRLIKHSLGHSPLLITSS